jgi:hypothetical protein
LRFDMAVCAGLQLVFAARQRCHHYQRGLSSGRHVRSDWQPVCKPDTACLSEGFACRYIVQNVVTVNHGVRLTILPGTELRFALGAGLRISGSLVARGTATDGIRFLSNSVSEVA